MAFKYLYCNVVLQEVPNEISLAVSLTGCKIRCPGCHSKDLWEDTGTELTTEELRRLLKVNEGITCIVFMGGDHDEEELRKLFQFIVSYNFWNESYIKIAWYSGKVRVPELFPELDYIKIGSYNQLLGDLTDLNSNQLFYSKIDNEWKDTTYLFRDRYRELIKR